MGANRERALLEAIERAQATIEFDVDGTVKRCNDKFLAVMGYTRDEVIGKHHQIFCDPEWTQTDDYRQFWQRLREGRSFAQVFQRRANRGRTVWLQASYNPVLDERGEVVGVVKFATDITEQREPEAKLAAISRAQAVIEFTPKGEVITANTNFLEATGYQLQEITGRPHSVFCTPEFAASQAYRTLGQPGPRHLRRRALRATSA